MKRLQHASNDSFWRTGWVYARVQHFVAFMYNGLLSLFLIFHYCKVICSILFLFKLNLNFDLINMYKGQPKAFLEETCGVINYVILINYVCPAGQVVLDTPLPLKSHKNCRISSIKPIAVSLSEKAQFIVKGFNLSRSSTRYPSASLQAFSLICITMIL